MTDPTMTSNAGPADHAEFARQRHQQLFSQPRRIEPLECNAHAQAIVAATTKLKNAVSGTAGAPVPLQHCPEMVATLLRHPDLWEHLSMLSAQVQSANAKLPARQRQLAIMRTVWLSGAPYQWGEHVVKSLRAGISAAEIDQIKTGSTSDGWDALDSAVLRAAEEFRDDTFVSDATWRVLAEHFNDAQLLELLALIGQFTTIAFILNSLRVALEPTNRGFLSP